MNQAECFAAEVDKTVGEKAKGLGAQSSLSEELGAIVNISSSSFKNSSALRTEPDRLLDSPNNRRLLSAFNIGYGIQARHPARLNQSPHSLPCRPRAGHEVLGIQTLGEDAEYLVTSSQWADSLQYRGIDMFGTPLRYVELYRESLAAILTITRQGGLLPQLRSKHP